MASGELACRPASARRSRTHRLGGVLAPLLVVIGLVPSVAFAAHQFPDVPDANPFHDDIGWMADLEITGGFADGGFHPGSSVTRQSMAAFLHRLARAVGEQDSASIPDPGFIDITPSHPFYDDIAWMADLGITGGFSDGTFRPAARVSRQSMAAFLHRLWLALDMDDPASIPDPGFSDVPTSHVFYDDIAWMAELEITGGFSDGTFRPTASVTRQSMAAFLHRMWGQLGFVVDVATDGVDATPGNGTCATAGGDCTLRAAVGEANALAGDDRIFIDPGVDPTLSVAGRTEDLNVIGDLDVTDDLTLAGGGATIDGAEVDRVLDVHDADVHIHDVTITGGETSPFWVPPGDPATDPGGGIRSSGDLWVTSSTVSDNEAGGLFDGFLSAASEGGGIAATGNLHVQDSTIADNRGPGLARGGGIAVSGTATIERTTITHNRAVGGAGGLWVTYPSTALVVNSTVSNNASLGALPYFGAGTGGVAGPGTLRATTVAGNDGAESVSRGPAGPSVLTVSGSVLVAGEGAVCTGAISSVGYNIASDDTCGLSLPTDHQTVNPLLGPLGDHGGPTATHLPFANSSAVDGIPAGTLELCDGSLGTDQRGEPRPQGAACDIGSVEGSSAAVAEPLLLTVDTEADLRDDVPGDGLCDTGAGTCSLRAAIDEANEFPTADAVTIAAGVNPALTRTGPDEDENATGDLDVTDDLAITGAGATIDANAIDRVIDLHGDDVQFNDVTLTGGSSPLEGGGIRQQGGVVVADGLRVEDNVVVSADSSLDGGGIFQRSGALSLHDSVVSNNAVSDNFGDPVGGGIFVVGGGNLSVTSSTIADNQVSVADGIARGGGLAVQESTVALLGTTVSDNSATGTVAAEGGGLYQYSGSVTIDESTIADNHVTANGGDASGGGILLSSGNITVEGSTIVGNTATASGGVARGGGMRLMSLATVNNSTISSNAANSGFFSSGGGVHASASTTITLSTLFANHAATGSGVVHDSGTLTLLGTLLANEGKSCSGTITSGGYNASADATCSFAGTGDQESATLALAALADSGGPTSTHLPGVGSVALEAIPASTAILCDGTHPTDQRGVARPQGGACDIGSVEQ